jgi:hypothetical protein
MFNFGSAEDTASLYWSESLNIQGPALPDAHFEEMEEQDLVHAFAYLYIALREAYRSGAADEVIELLTEPYDEVFEFLCIVRPEFVEAVLGGRHQYLPGWFPDVIKKYQGIAKAHLAN